MLAMNSELFFPAHCPDRLVSLIATIGDFVTDSGTRLALMTGDLTPPKAGLCLRALWLLKVFWRSSEALHHEEAVSQPGNLTTTPDLHVLSPDSKEMRRIS